MRKLLQILVTFLIATDPFGANRVLVAQAAKNLAAEQTQFVPISINIQNPNGLDEIPTPDFERDFTIPAHKWLIEQERQKRAAQAKTVAERLAKAGFKTDFAINYVEAEAKTGTPWQLIAAVHKIESGQRGDTTVASYAGAQGPMQFLPSTWRAYAKDGDGDGKAQIHDVDDAILTGANYLRAGGADKGNFYKALFTYNHADWYVQKVLRVARTLGLNA